MKTPFRLALLAVLPLLSLSGCFTDGSNGDKGIVRFSQMVNFLETKDFTSPLAVRRTVLVRLEHANPAVTSQLREDGWPELTLEVQSVSGGNAQVFPLGFAQFGVVPQDEGTFRLVAKENGKEVDSVKLTSAPIASLRLGPDALVVVRDGSCSRSTTVSTRDLALGRNDLADVTVVPLDKNGKPMLGMLQLTAKSSSTDLKLDTPLFVEGTVPNTLSIEVTGSGSRDAEVTVQEAGGQSLRLPISLTSSSVSACP